MYAICANLIRAVSDLELLLENMPSCSAGPARICLYERFCHSAETVKPTRDTLL